MPNSSSLSPLIENTPAMSSQNDAHRRGQGTRAPAQAIGDGPSSSSAAEPVPDVDFRPRLDLDRLDMGRKRRVPQLHTVPARLDRYRAERRTHALPRPVDVDLGPGQRNDMDHGIARGRGGGRDDGLGFLRLRG